MASPVLYDRLALIGVGLIGGSIARAARALGLVRDNRGDVAIRADAAAHPRTGSRRRGGGHQRRRGRRRRPGDRLRSDRRLRRGGERHRPAPEAGRDRLRRRLGQGRGGARHGAPHSGRRAFHPRPSRRRHGRFRAGLRLRRAVHQPLVHPHAAEGRRPGRRRAAGAILEGVRRQRRDHVAGASRPGARGHQPRPAPDRLQHRRHGVRPAPRHRVRKSSNIPPAAFAISPASPRPTRPCGATFS